MKYFLPLFMMVGLFGCPKAPVPREKPKTFVPSKNMQQIKSTATTLTLSVNEEAYYQASVHGSVGTAVELEIDNEGVIKVGEQKVDYENPERAEMPGGDAATKTFVLKALSAGKAKITIKNLYRGDLQSEQVIECIVSKE